MEKTIISFEKFLLNPHTRQLQRQSQVIEISSKGFDVLFYLIQKKGELATKDEIYQAVWGDTFVEENNIHVHISALRRILGEKRGESRFIKTVPGKGYIFIAEVEEKPFARVIAEKKSLINDSQHQDFPIFVAVLPFQLSTDKQELKFLANGISENLIENLSRLPQLKIMAFSAVREYQETSDLQETGFLLGVERILTGSIFFLEDNVEISLELVNLIDRSRIWGKSFAGKLDDIYQIQNAITLAIIEQFQIQLSAFNRFQFTKERPPSPEAFRLFLKGKFVFNNSSNNKFKKESLQTALRFYQQALKLDPHFAQIYTEIGIIYVYLYNIHQISKKEAYEKSKTNLQMALNLDENLSDAYILQGLIQVFFEQKLIEAQNSLKKAIGLNPNNPNAYHNLSLLLCYSKDFVEAIELENKALQLDPTSTAFNCGLLNRFYFVGDYRRAIIQAEEILELDENSSPAFFIMALSYAKLGIFEQSLKYVEKAYQTNPLKSLLATKAYIYALSGATEKAHQLLDEILIDLDDQIIDFSTIGLIYLALGDKETALDYLEKECQKLNTYIYFIRIEPDLQPLYNHPRFQALLNKYNFY